MERDPSHLGSVGSPLACCSQPRVASDYTRSLFLHSEAVLKTLTHLSAPPVPRSQSPNTSLCTQREGGSLLLQAPPSASRFQIQDLGGWKPAVFTALEHGSTRSYKNLELRMCVWFSGASASAQYVLRSAHCLTGGPWF